MTGSDYVIGVDIGTSSIRACLYDRTARLRHIVEQKVQLIYPTPVHDGELRVEIDPENLWTQFCAVVRSCVTADIGLEHVAAIGICCQRNTFITWDRETGVPCHRFITWKDCRGRDACSRWNSSWMIKMLNVLGAAMFMLSGQRRFMAARIFKFVNVMVTHRLMVTLDESAHMQQLLRAGRLAYGCIDTWLIGRLTQWQTVCTDVSSASSTGLFDPYLMNWGYMILNRVGFPLSVLPDITETKGVKPIAVIDSSIFGVAIPIGAIAGDQQAAAYGAGCWHRGQVKISLGTGTFVDVNTGNKPHASMNGLYPLVGWHQSSDDSIIFLAEASANDTAMLLNWAQSIGLFESLESLSDIAESVTSSGGVSFVPAFGGLQAPINDDCACCAFIGLRPDTSKAQMVRSMLESIAFRVLQIWNVLADELSFPLDNAIRCCGGVSRNRFICQSIADLLNRQLQRVDDESCAAAFGIALLAGQCVNIWTAEAIPQLIRVSTTFVPNAERRTALMSTFDAWNIAVRRCLHFYK